MRFTRAQYESAYGRAIIYFSLAVGVATTIQATAMIASSSNGVSNVWQELAVGIVAGAFAIIFAGIGSAAMTLVVGLVLTVVVARILTSVGGWVRQFVAYFAIGVIAALGPVGLFVWGYLVSQPISQLEHDWLTILDLAVILLLAGLSTSLSWYHAWRHAAPREIDEASMEEDVPSKSIDEPARSILRREFAITFASSICYFVGLLLFPSIVLLNPIILAAIGWFAGAVVVAGLIIGVPLARAGQTLAHRYPRPWVGLLTFFGVGALTAYLAFGVFALIAQGRFQPFAALGAHSGPGVGIVLGLAGLCTLGGWATARKYVTPTKYDDALEGLDFAELAELIRNARQDDKGSPR